MAEIPAAAFDACRAAMARAAEDGWAMDSDVAIRAGLAAFAADPSMRQAVFAQVSYYEVTLPDDKRRPLAPKDVRVVFPRPEADRRALATHLLDQLDGAIASLDEMDRRKREREGGR